MPVQDEMPAARNENQLASPAANLPVAPNVAAALCYMPLCAINLVAGIALLKVARDDKFLKHHALQGLVLAAMYMSLCVLMYVCGTICSVIPYMGLVEFASWLTWLGMTFVFLGLLVYGGIAAFAGKRGGIPIVSQLAEKVDEKLPRF